MLGRLWSIQVNQKRALWLTFQPAWPVTSNIYRFCFCGNILDTKEHIYIYIQLLNFNWGYFGYHAILQFWISLVRILVNHFIFRLAVESQQIVVLLTGMLANILTIGLMHSLHLQLILVAIVDVEPDSRILKKILEISHILNQKTLQKFC